MDDLYQQLKEISAELKRNNCFQEAKVLDEYLKQYCYRFLPLFQSYDELGSTWVENNDGMQMNFDYIEQVLFDGRYDKQHDDKPFIYHLAGIPRKLALRWHGMNSEYAAYLWFEDKEIFSAFELFYGSHPETKTDFMIRIDAEKNKYELSFYRFGLTKPQVISQSAYQLIVFNNKNECYRSDNYNQESGAWIW